MSMTLRKCSYIYRQGYHWIPISKIESGRTGATYHTLATLSETYGADWYKRMTDIRRNTPKQEEVSADQYMYQEIVNGAY
jgi:hypothetical protein